jgi:hypothetical protein
MKTLPILALGLVLLAGCARATSTPTTTPIPTPIVREVVLPSATPSPLPPTPSLAPSSTPIPTATTVTYPVEGLGPTGFPDGVDPLTGLEVADPALLERRPLVIKVENLPREHRPQSGLNQADIVYEYYTEQGGTRFAAIYYGTNSERVGPIRSGRFFDINLVQMYKGVFIFGSAYTAVWNRIVNSDFGNRLVIENSFSCPALCRFEPKGRNLLVADTPAMNDYLKKAGINNARQNLDGMYFNAVAPEGGQPLSSVYLRYSGAIYNRWDYDKASNTYQRYAETQNDVNRNNEVYALLTDQLSGKPIAADTLVTLCIPHSYYSKTAEMDVVDIIPLPSSGAVTSCDGKSYPGGTGPAYVARDGYLYAVTWKRELKTDLITLVGTDGKPFPFRPGRTWFEVMGASSQVTQSSGSIKFTFQIAP